MKFFVRTLNNLALYLGLGASALLLTASFRWLCFPPPDIVRTGEQHSNVRMVCNENRPFWRERSELRVSIREPAMHTDTRPRERYIERRL